MKDVAVRFFDGIANKSNLSDRQLVALFVYFWTVEQGNTSASASEVNSCFVRCDLKPPKRTAAYLSEGVNSSPPRYVKAERGYRLHRHFSEQLQATIGNAPVVVQTSAELRALEKHFPQGHKGRFLSEVIDCFEAKANRAAIIMCWILTMDHLFDYVFQNRLTDFNTALAKNPDKKLKAVSVKDDFSELREEKFIELCRASSIITNDIRKILDMALGVRNSAAHPSSVEIPRSKTIAVIEDLVVNVIRRFKV